MHVVSTMARKLANRIKSCEPMVLWMFAIVSAGGFIFLRLASEVLEGETTALDTAALQFFRDPADLSVPIGPNWLTHAVDDITSLGGTTVLTLMTVVTAVYLQLARQRAASVLVVLSVVGGWILSTLLKLGIARPRPDIVPHLVDVHDLSFPSGHAMLSAATYLTLGALLSRIQKTRGNRIFVIAVAMLLTFAIGLSRVYLGVHYPTDVLGGWCAGAAWATLCWIVARRYVFSGYSNDVAKDEQQQ